MEDHCLISIHGKQTNFRFKGLVVKNNNSNHFYITKYKVTWLKFASKERSWILNRFKISRQVRSNLQDSNFFIIIERHSFKAKKLNNHS